MKCRSRIKKKKFSIKNKSVKVFSPKEVLVEKEWGGRKLATLFGKKLPTGKKYGESWIFYDKKYPLVVKLIDVQKPISVQVHPPGKNGKSELWYILDTGTKTRALAGLKKGRKDFPAGLNKYKVKKGDGVYLKGGTVHTILPPAFILEISQNKLITYRLYDWDRGTRPLDLKKGWKAVINNSSPGIHRNMQHFRCPYFKMNLLKLKKGNKYNENGICVVLKGSVGADKTIIKKGQAKLIKGELAAYTDSEVFSVSPITSNSKIK